MDVSDLAKVIGYEVDSLLEAINQAGLSQSSANDNISTEDRKKILEHIKSTKKGTKENIRRIIAVGSLIETTDFLNISLKQKNIIKENMVWCNKQYKKYLDS